MALAPISRATSVTIANPTPPTNVVTQYQGSPPTLPGLTPPLNTPQPDVADANIFKFADPGVGAVATGNPVDKLGAPRPELAGLAEGDGTETATYNPPGATAANDWSSQRGTDGNYSETPNASHPSFNTMAK
jgi:hypothetical protein